MKTPEKSSEKPSTERNRQLVMQVDYLKKTVILLILACVTISVCLNVYVSYENVMLKSRVAELEEGQKGYESVYQFMQRLVSEFQYLARSEESIALVLRKYEAILRSYGLHTQAGAVSGP